MGKLRHILLVCLMFIMTSCEGLFYTDNVGQPIRFGASYGNKTIMTRTSYSGVFDGNTERIYWSNGDQVSIYMDWDVNRDGSGYTGNPEQHRGIYNVSPGSDFHPNDKRYGRISYANEGEVLKWQGDFKEGDGRAHEYPHTFYSAYPPTDLINGKFIFDLSNQDGSMKYAYMASYEEGVFSNSSGNDGHVELRYYPMITTFCLTIHNDLDERIEKITLKSDSDNKKLSGKYSVSVNNGSFRFNDYEGNNDGQVVRTVNIGSSETVKDILFFIIPQDFDVNELYFLLNSNETKKYKLPNYIEAYYKYNINITVSKEEPEVDGPFSSFVNGVILAEAHKQGSPFYHPGWQFGWVDGEQKIFWNNPDNYNNWEPVPDEFLWEIINGLVDLDVEGTWEIGYVVTPDDLNIFPNLRTVNIKGWFQKVEINNPNITELNIESTQLNDLYIHGCNSLTTFHVDNNNNFKNIVVKDCEILEYFTLTGPSGEGVNITCDSCPVLEWFSLTGGVNPDGSPWNFPFHKDIINCPAFDHYYVPGCIEN